MTKPKNIKKHKSNFLDYFFCEITMEVTKQRIKRKLEKGTTYDELLDGWTQCCYLVQHKLRLCNMARNPGSLYCGNHSHFDKNESGAIHAEERIPCPLDKSHTIFKKNIESHLKICNAAKQSNFISALPYYCENCNGGTNVNSDETVEIEVNLDELLQKVERAYNSIVGFIPEKVKSFERTKEVQDIHSKIREAIGKDQSAFKQIRHIEQDIALVDQLMDENLLSPSVLTDTVNRIILEFGAGKGLLGLSAFLADPSISLYLVERSSNRKKIDRFFNEVGRDDVCNKSTAFERIRMDIRHCYLPKVPKIEVALSNITNFSQVTVVAKHLCGVASDLAIRSLSNIHASSELFRRGLGIATCCHHACLYEDYTGHSFLRLHGISSRLEFDIIKHWSGWATLDRTNSSASEPKLNDHPKVGITTEKYRPLGLDPDSMKNYGVKVKRILDYGRVYYLQRELLFKTVKIVKYCEEELSPECMMILARE